MLSVIEKVVFVKMVHNGAMDYVFKDFAGNGDKRDGAVVFDLRFVAFFKDGDDPGLLPVVRDRALFERDLVEKGERVCQLVSTDF